MAKYRVTFFKKNASHHTHFDVEAASMREASNMMMNAKGRWARENGYTDVSVEEIPVGTSIIGIHFSYEDSVLKKKFEDYLFIKADSEKQARDYYNTNFKGKRFWFKAGVIDDTGKNIYGAIKETYFAGGSGFCADATA